MCCAWAQRVAGDSRQTWGGLGEQCSPSGGLGAAPPMTEEEAQPDDETKGVRRKPLLFASRRGAEPGQVLDSGRRGARLLPIQEVR